MTEKPQDPKELERQKLLEEIRKRAEEAEMRRIESEEEKSAFEVDQPGEQAEPVPVIAPIATPTFESIPLKPLDEHRLIDLRGRFAVAIDRRDVETASDLILDLASIIPDTTELASYEKKLRSLRMELKQARSKPVVSEFEDEETREQKERKKSLRAKKITALLEGSISLYEQEKYDKAASTVKELLELDPENDEAIQLRSNIEKAQELAAEVRAEEDRRKAADAAERPSEPEVVVEPSTGKKDFWGNEEIQTADNDFGLQLDKDTTPSRPKVPISKKIVDQASKISIPVKPLIFAAVMILAIIAGYYIAGEIQSSAGELSASLVVLPGWHAPSDSLAVFLSYALAEQVSADLSRSEDLRIIAPYTASTVKYVRGGPAAAARNLGVMHYLQWNIQTTPASVTVDFTLRDTIGTEPLWTARKQSSIRELPSAIHEISRAVLTALDLESGEASDPARGEGMTRNPDAFLKYLEGRYMLTNPRRYPVAEAAVVFDQALQRDPDFVEARVSKAMCFLLQAESSSDFSRDRLAGAAVLLNDGSAMTASSASVLSAHALLHQLQGDYGKAAEFLTTGIRSFPGDAEIRRRFATVMMIRGDAESALKNARHAVSLDPLNAESYVVLAAVEKSEGDQGSALTAYQRGASLSSSGEAFRIKYLPELFVSVQKHDSAEVILSNAVGKSRDDYVLYYRLGRIYQAGGKNIDTWEEILQRSQVLISRRLSSVPGDGIARSYLALVLTRLGRKKEAESEIQRALRDQRDHPLVLYNAARAYAMQKEFPSALEYLDKAIGVKYDPDLVFDMDFYNLRSEAEFLSVVTR